MSHPAPAQRRPRLRLLAALAIALAIAIAPLAAAPVSGLVGAETDDSSDLGAFMALLAAWPRIPGETLPIGGGIPVRVVDSSGAGVPYVSWRLTDGGKEVSRGSTFVDGGLSLPELSKETGPLRIELQARGAARVVSLPSQPSPGASLLLEGSRPLASPLPLEVVFVLDTTVSMAGRMQAVKRALSLSMDAIAGLGEGFSPRFGLVLFRDAGDDYLVRTTPLTADRGLVDAAIAGAAAAGGGDEEEDLGAGIKAALEGSLWKAGGLRMIFAITDAPPKAMAAAMEGARREGIKICAIGLGPLEPRAEFALRSLAASTGAPYIAADTVAVAAPRSGPGPSKGVVRGDVETIISRIVGAEAAAASGKAGAARDPALELLDSVQARMAASLAYPESARLRGAAGTVVLALKVDAGGVLAEGRVAASSGSAILDKAALDLAASSLPLPNPAAAPVELEIRVVYRLGK